MKTNAEDRPKAAELWADPWLNNFNRPTTNLSLFCISTDSPIQHKEVAIMLKLLVHDILRPLRILSSALIQETATTATLLIHTMTIHPEATKPEVAMTQELPRPRTARQSITTLT